MKLLLTLILGLSASLPLHAEPTTPTNVVDASSLRGKVMCGYQGWFRCPGDRAGQGWVHWSRDSQKITPETLTFEMWPDTTDFPAAELFAAPGFTNEDGSPACLYSADQTNTVLRHFEWMRTYGIDGVWLQHFLVDLPGGPLQSRYESRTRVLQDVRAAARQTGRAWAIAFDIAGMPTTGICETLTNEWEKLVNEGITADNRYVHQNGKPVVLVWGFYYHDPNNAMSPTVANQLIDFFKAPGPFNAFLVGGGDWWWRENSDPEWQAFYRRFDACSPWNVGNYDVDDHGNLRASMDYWTRDQAECKKYGMLWLPVIYPGFAWDNLKKFKPGKSVIPRRHGEFLWEQFHALSELGADSACVAMFDEVDEGTAIFKISNTPPKPGHFVTYDGLPGDWYLRLVGEGTRLLREKQPIPAKIPVYP